MSRLRKHAPALALVIGLFVTSGALAAPRGDDSRGRDLGSRVRSFIVKILEDIRANFPPG